MTDHPEIKPCPWCGMPAERARLDGSGYYVQCTSVAEDYDSCCAAGPTVDDADQALADWNRIAGLEAKLDAARDLARSDQAIHLRVAAQGIPDRVIGEVGYRLPSGNPGRALVRSDQITDFLDRLDEALA